ncbi:hypothetical protein DFJ73DRAFT_762253 [Zopfochytrium polystomum]|nr:hypothetical protein DFJ73DRAFT_762253 [Zopfochytrium polystomum]
MACRREPSRSSAVLKIGEAATNYIGRYLPVTHTVTRKLRLFVAKVCDFRTLESDPPLASRDELSTTNTTTATATTDTPVTPAATAATPVSTPTTTTTTATFAAIAPVSTPPTDTSNEAETNESNVLEALAARRRQELIGDIDDNNNNNNNNNNTLKRRGRRVGGGFRCLSCHEPTSFKGGPRPLRAGGTSAGHSATASDTLSWLGIPRSPTAAREDSTSSTTAHKPPPPSCPLPVSALVQQSGLHSISSQNGWFPSFPFETRQRWIS